MIVTEMSAGTVRRPGTERPGADRRRSAGVSTKSAVDGRSVAATRIAAVQRNVENGRSATAGTDRDPTGAALGRDAPAREDGSSLGAAEAVASTASVVAADR